MSKRAIFAADLHGNRYAYDRLFRLAEEEGIETIILGGDLTPKWPIISWYNRTLIPLVPKIFRPDQNGVTYTDFLGAILPLVGKNRSQAERHFVSLGGFVVHTGEYLKQEELLAEQAVLRRLIDEYGRGSSGTGKSFCMKLSAKEWSLVEKLIRSAELKNESLNLDDLLLAVRYETLGVQEITEATTALDDIKAKIVEIAAHCAPEVKQYLEMVYRASLSSTRRASTGAMESLARNTANQEPLAAWIRKARIASRATVPQKRFLEVYLRKRLREFQKKMPGATVYAILGNDDVRECEPVFAKLEKSGLLSIISERVMELPCGLKIAGYPYVRESKELFYDGWGKSEDEIESDLTALEKSAGDPSRTIFVVHTPPFMTKLDQSFGDAHFGSAGVKNWLASGQKHLVLSGHIHEAPFMNGGVWREEVSGTLCMQPGGWHDEGLCAVIFDLENPTNARWINSQVKV